MQCTPEYIGSGFFFLKCPVDASVTTFDFTIDTHSASMGSYVYKGVHVCAPPLNEQ
jgi:hypothetical protein